MRGRWTDELAICHGGLCQTKDLHFGTKTEIAKRELCFRELRLSVQESWYFLHSVLLWKKNRTEAEPVSQLLIALSSNVEHCAPCEHGTDLLCFGYRDCSISPSCSFTLPLTDKKKKKTAQYSPQEYSTVSTFSSALDLSPAGAWL